MSAEENKAIVRRAYEAINQKNLDALDEMVASDIIDHDPAPGQGPGLEGVKQYFSSMHTAFPDVQMNIDDMIAEGDKVVARGTWNGTHEGEFMGIPAIGRRVTVSQIDIARCADGRMVEHWGQSDALGLMQQLAVVPPPEQVSGRV